MAPAKPYAIVSPPFWDNEEVWILGGGPSANTFDFQRIRRCHRIVSVNGWKASACGGRLPAIFSLDNHWIRRHRTALWHYRGEKYFALPLETWPECGGIRNAVYLQWSHADGLSDQPDTICCGCNSGYGAINLAYLKHAKVIHLVGFDMDPNDKEEFRTWAPLFRNMLPQLNARGTQVLNHNPDSFIDAFQRVP